MFDSANAALWVDSLMWSLLSSLIVMPALLLVSHAAMKKASRRKKASQTRNQQQASSDEEKPFVDRPTRELQTLWPEPEQKNEWPPSDVAQEQRRSQRSARAEA